jgi:hypothetical protein
MWLLVLAILLILLLQSRRISFFPDSAIDVYKDMAAGTAQINALADYLQEKEDDMKTLEPYFEGEGFNLDYSIPMHPAGDDFDDYDYSKPVDFDFSKDTSNQSGLPSEQSPIAQSPVVQYSAVSPVRM